MRLYPPEEIFAVFIFAEWKRDALTTPHMHVYQRPNDEAKQDCATMAYSSFCVEAFAIMKVSRLHAGAGKKTGLLNRRIQHCWSRTQQLRSHQFHPGSFFRSLYFRGSWSVCENCKNLHPAKISHCTVGAWYVCEKCVKPVIYATWVDQRANLLQKCIWHTKVRIRHRCCNT